MASILRLVKKTLRRGENVVRRVGSVSRKTLRRGTNVVGLTKRRKTHHKRKTHGKKH
jgi:hypothetical protein